MRYLLVGPYPPRPCGIGAYVATQASRLRAEGHAVEVLSPPDGAGEHRVPFRGGRPFLRAVRVGRAADVVVVHFQPALYYRPRRPVSKVLTSLGLLWLVLRRPRTEVLVHEADRPRPLLRPDYLLLSLAFRRARLAFHTDTERRLLERHYRLRARRFRLVPHTAGVTVHPPATREEARRRLGIDPEETLFVCAGFLHPAKGFDRAVRAFAAAGPPGRRRLVVVGSVREPAPENLKHAALLREMCAETPGITLKETYLSDEEFDVWVKAADRLVLPYRQSWSSGVLARARALGTPAVVSAVGGLPEQAGPEDVVFHDDDELAAIMASDVRAAVTP